MKRGDTGSQFLTALGCLTSVNCVADVWLEALSDNAIKRLGIMGTCYFSSALMRPFED